MKRTAKRSKSKMGLALCLTAGVLASGCTHTAARRQKVAARLEEESKALTTAVVDTLQSQPSERRDVFTETALIFAKQDQRVEGLPVKPLDVPSLLAELGATNAVAPAAITNQLIAERFAKEDGLIAERAKVERRLMDLGARAEEARNRKISFWSKWSLWGMGILGGSVALFVACPLALPIAGRALGWLVGKLPGLASLVGVVSVKAFDAVVRGIENAKKTSVVAPTVPVANTLSVAGDSRRDNSASWVDNLQTHLSREMDAAHKALVRARKAKEVA
jgi:hypothetical protein